MTTIRANMFVLTEKSCLGLFSMLLQNKNDIKFLVLAVQFFFVVFAQTVLLQKTSYSFLVICHCAILYVRVKRSLYQILSGWGKNP